ncbi:hypothetical protein FDU21_08835 [Xanthomonas oryzae pv. oryzae]|nr:hypothetical protein FDU21_08835 [Xanthomonas oryzae pv. oryzae]
MAKYSIKARENLQTSLMSMQASLFVNLMSMLLIAPIGFFGVALYKGERLELAKVLGEQSSAALGGILCAMWPFLFGMLGRKSAMKIYNALYPDA